MGLDMYLNRHHYVGGHFEHRQVTGKVYIITGTGTEHQKILDIDATNVSEIICQQAYWRKDNHIHRWFVNHVQDGADDCKQYYVEHEQLKELVELCKRIRDDHSLAPKLLPTQEGFFFGSQEYDDYYFQSLDYTIEALSGLDESCEYYYQSSW